MIVAQRIIRPKGSESGFHTGGVHVFRTIGSLIAFAKKQKKVFSYLTDNGSHGIVRSGRKMRPCDSNVRNVGSLLAKKE